MNHQHTTSNTQTMYSTELLLSYGTRLVPLPPRFPIPFTLLRPVFPTPLKKPKAYIEHLLDTPLKSKPFNDFIKKHSRVTIIISDITRSTLSELYLPIIINRLQQRGVDETQITIISALGIHRKHTVEEHKKLVGAELYQRIRVIDHDAFSREQMVHLGTTTRETPLELNRLLIESDHVILTGSIRFHYFAGYGGGRKSILPGVSSFNACVANHLLVLNPHPQGGRHPLAHTGILEGNPVHEDKAEACNYLPSLFLFNTILSPQRELLKAVAGDVHDAFAEGCSFLKEHFCVPVTKKADLVVVSCGGHPWDSNFIQAHKTMDMAAATLKEGGVMILLAECAQGFGNPRFIGWFNHESAYSFERNLRLNYEINGQTAYATFLKAKRYQIVLLSSLTSEEVKRMSLIPASTLDEALDIAYSIVGTTPLTYLIPEGSSMLPSVNSP